MYVYINLVRQPRSCITPRLFNSVKLREMRKQSKWYKLVAMSKHHILYVHWGCGHKAMRILDPGSKWRRVYILPHWQLYSRGKNPWTHKSVCSWWQRKNLPQILPLCSLFVMKHHHNFHNFLFLHISMCSHNSHCTEDDNPCDTVHMLC
jgi:hypothetical protein